MAASNPMFLAALIGVVSFVVLLQFLIIYARLLIRSSSRIRISEQVLNVAGISDDVPAAEFGNLVTLLYLCPNPGNDRLGLQIVKAYFWLLQLMSRILKAMAPWLTAPFEKERGSCARFIAVLLDHRIAFSREKMTQQAASRL
jgi:hypothetical protein